MMEWRFWVDAKKRNRRGRIQEDLIPVEIGWSEILIIKITNQGNELLVEEGVRVEIMCQAKGRPQPEVAMPMLVILVILMYFLPIASVALRVSIEEAPKYF